MAKMRLDQLLVERDITESRSKAQALIASGNVFSGAVALTKSSQQVDENLDLTIKALDHPWVSRGGIKLDHAIRHFNIKPEGKSAIDVGASTGGFTDVLLHYGAAQVFAVDVGHGQLAAKLREDARVVALEKTNARYLTGEQIPDTIDMVVCDASFIGLEVVLPASLLFTRGEAELITLIKPQFEVGREQLGKSGVVKDPVLHQQVCERISHWINRMAGWKVQGITESPITGPAGNKEFLLYAVKR